MADPDVDNVYYWIGPNPTVSQGRMMINLKPRDERRASAGQIIARLKPKLVQVQGIALFMQVRQDIQVGGRPSKTQYQYTLQDGNSDELARWAPVFEKKLKSLPQLQDVTSDTQASAPRATLRIDRDNASRLGITPQAIDDTLYDAFGQRQVATIFTQLNQYHVVLELDPQFQLDTGALRHLYVRSAAGQLVPFSTFTRVEESVAPITGLVARIGGWRRGVDGIGGGPVSDSGRHRAIQSEPRSPSSHPEAAAQSDELGRL